MRQDLPPNLPLDLRDLLRIFNEFGVEYLIIGGVAYGYYAQPRYTKDLDLFINPSAANAALVYRALARFGVPLKDVSEADLTDHDKSFRFGKPPVAVDILPGVPGLDFAQAWNNRVSGLIDVETGLEGHLISKDDLVASKLAAGRDRDLRDVADIRTADRATKSK